MAFLKLIRAKNLLIVAVTQFLLQYLIIAPYTEQIEQEPILDIFHFSLLVFVTVSVAASGYIINDFYDVEIDAVNKPNGLIINNLVSGSRALIYYWGLVVLGAFPAIYLAFFVQKIEWFLIYPGAVYLLFEYARFFKRVPVAGNLIVAFFSAGVAGIVIFPEVFSYYFLEHISGDMFFMLAVFCGYIFFAFCSTMYREVIKDLEDIEGDQQFGAKTLPVVSGIKNAKIFAGIWGFLLGIIFTWLVLVLFEKGRAGTAIFGILSVLLPLFFSFYKLVKSETSSDFGKLSELIKWVMLGGLLFLIILVKF